MWDPIGPHDFMARELYAVEESVIRAHARDEDKAVWRGLRRHRLPESPKGQQHQIEADDNVGEAEGEGAYPPCDGRP